MLFRVLASLVLLTLSTSANDALIQRLLQCHNKLRSHLALEGEPKASNMYEMKYNHRYALLAKSEARKKLTRATQEMREHGVTIFHLPKFATIEEIVDEFCKINTKTLMDRKFYGLQGVTEELLDAENDNSLFNALQMIWGDATRVGCSYDTWGTFPEDETILVCVYNHAVKIGERVYDMGRSCARCLSGHKCNRKSGLCQDTGAKGGYKDDYEPRKAEKRDRE